MGKCQYFRNLETHTLGAGLTTYFTTLDYKFSTKIKTSITYHQFFLSNFLIVNNAALDKNLGNEIDIIATYKIKKETMLNFGYSFILPTNSLEFVQNIPTNTSQNGHYAWLMLRTNLKLL